MKIKNTSSKLVSVGTIMMLPDEIATVSDANIDNPGIMALVGKGYLAIVDEPKHEDSSDAEHEEAEAAEAESTGTKRGGRPRKNTAAE